jgi:hypothetical protein
MSVGVRSLGCCYVVAVCAHDNTDDTSDQGSSHQPLGADEGNRQLGLVVLALAEEVEGLGREVQDLTRRAR